MSAQAPMMTPMEQLTEFARRHSGDFIVINFAPNEQGITPPPLRGRLRKQLVEPEANSHYTSLTVFPRAGTVYAHIMTSTDGNSISGQFSPSDKPSAEEERRMLHELIASAALSNSKLEEAIERAASERQSAQNERNMLLDKTQQGDAERLILLEKANKAAAERDILLNRAQAADNDRSELRSELILARQQRDALQSELRAAAQQRQEQEARIHQLEQVRTHSPQPNLPSSTTGVNPTDFAAMMQQMTLAFRAMSEGRSSTSTNMDSLAVYLNPITASHGTGASPLISPQVIQSLESANFEIYKWTTTASFASRIRVALSEIVAQLQDPKIFTAWATANHFTFTPSEWALYTTGSKQAALELSAAVKLHDRGIQSILIFARQASADPTQLQNYISGSLRVPDSGQGVEKLLGSHNGVTNKCPSNTASTSNRTTNDKGGRGRGGGGKGRASGPTHQVQGGGVPEMSALNALVHS